VIAMKRIVSCLPALLIAGTLLGISLLSLRTAMANQPGAPSSAPLLAGSALYRVLDDFNSGASRECYADEGGQIVSPCPIITDSPGYVVMSYNVTMSPTAYAFLPTQITPSGSTDLSGWNSVWVMLRGQSGGEKIYAEFARDVTHEFHKVIVDDYLGGGISTTWRAAAIPFSAFGLSDWSSVDRFSLVAYNAISSGVGEIDMDEVRLLPSVVTIDDFHDLERENELGGDSSRWENGGTIAYTYNDPNGVLKLSYAVPLDAIGAGYATDLRSTNLLSWNDALSFDILGNQGGEELTVELKDCGLNGQSHAPRIQVSDYLGEGIMTSWRRAVIPLAAFVDEQYPGDKGVDWGCIAQMAFNISGQSPYTGAQGMVYIDNIQLAPANGHYPPLLVDRFRDCNDWNTMLGRWYSHMDGTGQFTAALDNMNSRDGDGCAYRLTFNVSDSDSAYTWTELKGLDISDYTHLWFHIKGKNGNEITRVYLRDQDGNQQYMPIQATQAWQHVLIPTAYFTDFSTPVNLARLNEVKFAFEQAFQSGEVYIDDIEFIDLSTVRLPIILTPPPTNLYLRNYTGGAVSYTVQSIGALTVPVTSGDERFLWGSFRPGEYSFSWYKLSNPKCWNSGRRTWPPGDFEPPPMVCY
jgi:hypothetical protein